MKHISTIFTFVFSIVFTSLSMAQIEWTKYEGNPVLSTGPAGVWDDSLLIPHGILFDGTTYHIWYGGYDGTNVRIGYATSDDGISWEKYAGNPVLDVGSQGEWDARWVYRPSVLYNDSTWHMWYSGYNGSNVRIGYATSEDGITWTKYQGNPVMDLGPTGEWDDYHTANPCVLFMDGQYHMWYEGGMGGFTYIGYATSEDGITWTRYDENPVIRVGRPGSWEYPKLRHPEVFFDGSTYHMWYSGNPVTNQVYSIGYAASSDGISWTKYAANPILTKGKAGSWDDKFVLAPRVVFDSTHATFKMWYVGGADTDLNWGISYATAPLSIIRVPDHYATIQEAIDASSDGNTVLVDEGTYYENINFKGKAITVASRYWFDGDTSHISKTIIDGSQPANPDSGSVVYFVSGEDTTSILMGFTITNGTGTKSQYTYEGNKYDFRGGGGIICWNSGGRFVFNKIKNNSVSYEGYGVFGGGVGVGDVGSDAWTVLEKNHIINNSASGYSAAGGGAYLHGNMKLVDNIISYNSCTATDYWAGGGGVHTYTIPSVPCTAIIENNHIDHNLVKGKITPDEDNWAAGGGGIKIYRSKVLIKNNKISNNILKDFDAGNGYGGGIYMYLAASGSIINGNIISYNTSECTHANFGGGISLGICYGVSITNNLISGNSATHGGGLRMRDFNPDLINNTIVNNTASANGGGLYIQNSQPVVINSIIWNNQAANGIYPSSLTKVQYSDVQGSYTGEGNIEADPLFYDVVQSEGDTLFCCLQEGSPCIDSGNPDTSYYDIEDPQNPGYALWPAMETLRNDMGAYGGYGSTDIIVGIKKSDDKSQALNTYQLSQNYPNPFNPVTMINYQLPITSDVELSIYNLLGQRVATLVNERKRAGYHQVEWDASNMASGVYLYRLEAEGFVETRKMILMR